MKRCTDMVKWTIAPRKLALTPTSRKSPPTEVQTELFKNPTSLFLPETHERLSELVARRGKSLGELVREDSGPRP